jgi:hypothetical protein
MTNPTFFRTGAIALAIASIFAIGVASADPAPVPGHPRVNEVNQRLDNQQNRVQAGVADGQLNAKPATRDEKQDANIAQRESKDEAKNGGHLTKNEQQNLNKSLNHDSNRIHKQRTAG